MCCLIIGAELTMRFNFMLFNSHYESMACWRYAKFDFPLSLSHRDHVQYIFLSLTSYLIQFTAQRLKVKFNQLLTASIGDFSRMEFQIDLKLMQIIHHHYSFLNFDLRSS